VRLAGRAKSVEAQQVESGDMSPRILIIQERGHHEKNREFRESENFKRAFHKLGVTCEVWGLGYSNYSVPFPDIAKNYDVVFVVENYDRTG
jgi:hypothetical protein